MDHRPITYAIDFPKIRGAVLAAAIGGALAGGSIAAVFEASLTLLVDEARWAGLLIEAIFVLLPFLALAAVYARSRRHPLPRHLVHILLLGFIVCLLAAQASIQIWDWLVTEGVEPLADFGIGDWLYRTGLAVALLAVGWVSVGVWLSRDDGLALADDDLTCVTFDRRRRWVWHELSEFELRERGGLLGRLLGRRVAVEDRQKLVLADVWDRPLKDVLAGLNDHRERALARRRGSGSR